MSSPQDTTTDAAQPDPQQIGRSSAWKYLINRHQARESILINKQPGWRVSAVAGLQAALASAIALPLIYLSPWSHMIGYASLGTLAALFGRFAPRATRSGIVLRCAFWLTVAVVGMSAAAAAGFSFPWQIALLSLACGLFFFVSVTGAFGMPGAIIFIFAASAGMGEVISFQTVLERGVVTGGVALLAWAICAGTEHFRLWAGRPSAPEPLPPLRQRLIVSSRIALASAVAAYLAFALGATHPGWAAIAVVAVMQGAHLHITLNRAMQRMAGTLVGAVIVGIILMQGPTTWMVILLLVALIVATEIVIGTNYGLGQVFVTPMALLMLYLARPGSGIEMVQERIFDTLLGAVVGIVAAVLLSTFDDRARLARHHAARIRAGEAEGTPPVT